MSKVAIALICDDGYVLPTVVAITSIVENKLPDTVLEIFVVTTGLSDKSRNLFSTFASDSVHITVEKEDLGNLETLHTTVDGSICVATPAALLKFRLPDIVREYDKILYLDGDIIVREDLSALYEQDISGYSLAAVVDSGSIYYTLPYTRLVKDFFNSGVMLLNLKKMREDNSRDRLIETKRNLHDSSLMDQNVFNVVFDGEVKLLPLRYNVLYVNLTRSKSKFTIEQLNDRYGTTYSSLQDIGADAAIIHFSSKDKPWLYGNVVFGNEWYGYFILAKRRCPEILSVEPIAKPIYSGSIEQTPKVSVIIPAYNVEKYINASMLSILQQTLTDIQIICVDDGSEDATLDTLNLFAQTDSRVLVISQRNQGQSIARNVGLSMATGEYVYFFDSDDLIDANALEILYEQAKRTGSQNVLFDGVSFFETDALEKAYPQYVGLYERSQDYPGVYRGDELYAAMKDNGDYTVQPCMQFFDRSFLVEKNLDFRSGIIHEDDLFSFKALLLCERATHLRLKLFHRRIRENSTMTQAISYRNFAGHYVCFVEMIEFIMLHEQELSDSAVIAAKNSLRSYFKTIYSQYWALPSSERNRPQFLPPIQNFLSEIAFLPIFISGDASRTSSTHGSRLVPREQAKALYGKLSSFERESKALRRECEALRSTLTVSSSIQASQKTSLLRRKFGGLKRQLIKRGFWGTVRYSLELLFGRK